MHQNVGAQAFVHYFLRLVCLLSLNTVLYIILLMTLIRCMLTNFFKKLNKFLNIKLTICQIVSKMQQNSIITV